MHKFNLGERAKFTGLASNKGQCVLISLWFSKLKLNL